MGLVHYYPALNRPAEPICSICIANYNGVALLTDCLESVLTQIGGFCIEIIVHDDASTDGSVEWLRQKYPEIELLVGTENVGFCVSNNRMAEHARGRYILLLNNDAALYPDALSNLLEAAQAQVSPGILTLPQYDWTTGALVDRGCLLDPFYNPVPNLDPGRHEVAMVIGACLFVPRDLWNTLQGFPQWLESIGEDLYLCCQARLRGASVQVTPESGYRHRQGASFGGNRVTSKQLQTTYRRRALSERNKTFVLFVMTPGLTMWPLLAVHLVLLVVEGLVLSLFKINAGILKRIYWPAIAASFRNWGTLRTYRAREQETRQIELTRYLSTVRLFPRKFSLLRRYGMPKIK